MRNGDDWIIYLFAVLFALHACITIGVLIYRLTRAPKGKKREEIENNKNYERN